METGPTLKHKVTVKLNYHTAASSTSSSRPPSRNNITNVSRPASPSKLYLATNGEPEPVFRAKAKVNSSATTRKATNTASGASTSSTPRAGSPTKMTTRIQTNVVLPTAGPKLRTKSTIGTGLRSRTPVSAPVTPELRNRSLTTTSEAVKRGRTEESRGRTPSVSQLHHAVSFSSFKLSAPSAVSPAPRLVASKSTLGLADREQTSSPTMRIRSKVSGIATSVSESPPGPVSPPIYPSTRPGTHRARVPSTSSNVSQQPSSPPLPQFYPITTSSPAANPHRFATTRIPAARANPPTANYVNAFQSFHRSPTGEHSRPNIGMAKVDPVSIPLPPHSPPASALSFSSRSSVSRSSASYAPDSADSRSSSFNKSPDSNNYDHLSSTLDTLVQYTSANSGDDSYSSGHGETDGDQEGQEAHRVKAAAKSNRKIEDLEISNRSLLAINASLEAAKNRQAKEIRELRRKLRESRLLLPPKTFNAVKSSLRPSDRADDEEDVEDTSEGEELVEGQGDEIYTRIKMILETLLQSGQQALEREVKDFPEGGKGGAKVLSAEEVRDWHGSKHGSYNQEKFPHQEDGVPFEADLSFDDPTMTSEDEVEAMTMFSTFPPTSPPPPILVTEPT